MDTLSGYEFLLYRVPYSGKLSREKSFVFFAVLEPSVKVFSTKFCNPQCTRCMYAGALCMCEGHTYIIIGPEQSAKVFSTKFSFCTETQKFSAIRYICKRRHVGTCALVQEECNTVIIICGK